MRKISIVSGGSGGLGLEIASLLMRSGRDVLILGTNREKLRKAARKLSRISEKAQISTLVCDIGNEEDIKNTERFLRDHDITAEYLYNNAGKGLYAGATAITSAMIDTVFEANLKGMILLTSMILRITSLKNELTIVNIMSTSALVGRVNETVYCASKWGARGYTEALRAELKGTRRNIIAVYPGGMKTDFYKTTDSTRDISRFMNPAEVAEKIVSAVLDPGKLVVTDITINRKR